MANREVTFQYTEEDLQALFRYYPWYKRWTALLSPLLFTLLGMLLASIMPVMLGFLAAVLILWTVFGVAGTVMLLVAIAKQPRVDLARVGHPITLRWEEDFWSTIGEFSRLRRDWSSIQRVDETGDHVFIEIESFSAYVIPKTAFASSQQAHDFAEFARRKVNAASAPDGRQVPRWALSERELLHTETAPDVIRVHFTPTMEQVMEFELHGLNPPQRTGYSWWVLIGFLGVGALGILSADIWTSHGMLMLCLAVALLSGLLATQLYGVFRRWQWVGRFKRQHLEATTLVASPRGISQCTASIEGFVDWRAYEKFSRSEKHFVLYGRPCDADNAVFSVKAFANVDDVARFEALVSEHVKPATANALGDGQVVEKTPETGNPYQPPRQDA